MLKNLKKRLKDQRGLTLVELLAVIVILGIIAAIAVPSIGNIIAKSKFDAAKSDALQILAAASMAEAGGEELTKANIEKYLDITNDNISGEWTVTKVDGKLKLAGAVSKHNPKNDTSHTFAGTRDEINKMTYDNPGGSGTDTGTDPDKK
ncbi:type IV pilin protein [Cytobacillus praedii]|uniref:Prepilin-type N-terminal cleavage/methylation domain-containing protein n=1 Tax=Cytobacillus praedii TaxID=1742358 RepID=A0A4R1AQY5_9BACI|nr:prepilin-type N-terminal cleavage/methylation domain-containing protein [Cytobacillus praedii]TCJ02436.1 prepilin-type N-terminal cleavage/methylation domain-containing protein [Cytobacillus praedii]